MHITFEPYVEVVSAKSITLRDMCCKCMIVMNNTSNLLYFGSINCFTSLVHCHYFVFGSSRQLFLVEKPDISKGEKQS